MTRSTRTRRGRRLASAAVLSLALSACAAQPAERQDAPRPSEQPSSSAPSAPPSAAELPSTDVGAPTSGPGNPSARASTPTRLPRSEPILLAVPKLEVRSEPMHVGLRQDGSLEVPPGDPGAPAAWYVHSPTPGERGPSVFLGHVNAYGGGPGVFARLGELDQGDVVEVRRQDGTTAVFEVTRVQAFGKDHFPTEEVYGNTDDAQLRLITCDGYNPFTRSFEDNLVVFARLTETR